MSKINLTKTLRHLNSPWQIQEYISQIPYNPEDFCRSAERVYLERKAHCMEGALFAALALERIGHPAQMLHLRAHRDDDHVVALFQEKGMWGAVGKSNTTLLSWRPPYYRSLQELFLSYFPFYFNTKGQLSLYEWAGPIRLSAYEKKWNWRTGREDLGDLSASFNDRKGHRLLSPKEIEKLPKVSEALNRACFLGSDRSGLYGC